MTQVHLGKNCNIAPPRVQRLEAFNAKTYMNVGEGMGKAMVELMKNG